MSDANRERLIWLLAKINADVERAIAQRRAITPPDPAEIRELLRLGNEYVAELERAPSNV